MSFCFSGEILYFIKKQRNNNLFFGYFFECGIISCDHEGIFALLFQTDYYKNIEKALASGQLDVASDIFSDTRESYRFSYDDLFLIAAVEKGDRDRVSQLLSIPTFHGGFVQAFTLAAADGHLSIAKDLHAKCLSTFGQIDQTYYDHAFHLAACGGFSDILSFLIPYVDPKKDESDALLRAVRGGHIEATRVLLPVSDPKAGDSYFLSWAVQCAHHEIFHLLLPHSDPRGRQSLSLRLACGGDREEFFNILYPLSDPETALDVMRQNKNHENNIKTLQDRIRAEASKKDMHQHLDEQGFLEARPLKIRGKI